MSQLFPTSQSFSMSETQQTLSTTSGQSSHHTPSLLPQTSNSTSTTITNPQLVQMMNNTLNSSTTAEYMKWSDSEVSMLIQWLKKPENMDMFFNKKKVTAIKKIRELLPQKTERQIKNKLASLESTYKKAKQKLISNWGYTTPETDGYNTTEEKIKRSCPFYDDLDIIFTNGVQSQPVTVDLSHTEPENLNNLTESNTSFSSTPITNELSKYITQNKRETKKTTNTASNTLSQIGIDSNLSSLIQIIDSRILQRNEGVILKGNITDQKLLLKEKLYERKLQSKERRFNRKEKMFESKMHLKEKELELVNKELDIRKFEAEVKMEEIKLKRQIQESNKTNNKNILNVDEIGKRRKFN